MDDVQILGLAELGRAIEAIKSEVRNKLVMRALHDGARIIRDEAKRRAPKGTGKRFTRPRRKKDGTITPPRVLIGGLLRSQIVEHADRAQHFRVVIRVRNRGYERVNGRLRFKRPGSAPGYWWLVEFGTSKVPPNPFMRGAFRAKREEAARRIADSMRAGIEAVARQNNQPLRIAA